MGRHNETTLTRIPSTGAPLFTLQKKIDHSLEELWRCMIDI